MNNLFKVLQKDIKADGFTKREYIIYGIIAPLALVAACVLAERILTL